MSSVSSDLNVSLAKFAELFKQGWRKMPEEERKFVGSLDDFTAPYQIDVLLSRAE